MPAFDYSALDGKGRTKSGVIAAESEREARRRLKSSQLYVTALAPSKSSKKRQVDFFASDKIAPKELALITRQLATMLEAGAPVEEAIGAIADQAEKPGVRRVLFRVRSSVMEGKRLSKALAEEPTTFDSLYCSMVAAGENAGDLGRVLSRVADHREKAEETRGKIQAALMYPAVLAVVATCVVCALMIFVVPKVVAQFEGYGHDLPFVTKLVMGVSNFLVHYGVFLLVVLVLALMGFTAGMRQKPMRMRVHSFLLQLPLIGKLIRAVNSARFARSVSTLLQGGSPLLEAMSAAQGTLRNSRMNLAMQGVISQVREGVSASSAIKQSGEFVPMLSYMMAAGEKTGQLSDMLARVADYLDREFDDFTKKALSLLEPLIVVMMGVVVGVVVMSIMLPILQLNSLILN